MSIKAPLVRLDTKLRPADSSKLVFSKKKYRTDILIDEQVKVKPIENNKATFGIKLGLLCCLAKVKFY
jgi:hypothetical protein